MLLIFIITAALFYKERTYLPFHNFLISFGYIGIFLGGFFYAYGFTAAPATAVLLVLAREQSLFSAVVIGGLGALFGDIIIFLFIRHSFIDEIENLKKETIVKSIKKIRKKIFCTFDNYLLPIIAGLFIASPLPTEIGVSIMATFKSLSMKKFLIIAYLLHTVGIFIILLIGNAI